MKRFLTSSTPVLLTFVAVAAAAVACTVTTTNDPGAGGTSSSSSSSSSGGTTDGGASSSSGGEEVNANIGTISLTQTSFAVGQTNVNSYSIIASFAEGTSGTGTAGNTKCTTAKDGDCTVTECDLTPAGDAGSSGAVGDAGTAKLKHAGDIAIGASMDTTLTPDDKGSYPYKTGQAVFFESEEEIDVDAKGADIPAFKATMKAPTFITLSEPAFPAAGQPFTLTRANALNLKWDAGTSGDVMLQLSTVSTSKMASVSCTFKASAGAGTVAPSALGKLLTDGNGSISVNAMSTTTTTAGDWKVNVSAIAPAKAGSALASGQLKVQ